MGWTDSTWEFAAGDYNWLGRPDVMGVRKQSGSGFTEVHALTAEAFFDQFAVQTTTALGTTTSTWQFEFADWDGDGRLDLFGIYKAGLNATEVHIFSGAGGPPTFQSPSLLSVAAALHPTNCPSWEFAVAEYNGYGRPDLIGIKKQGTYGTEVHLYLGENLYGEAGSLHTSTPLGFTDSTWTFDAGDFNHDTVPDLFAIKMEPSCNFRTGVRILPGSGSFQSGLLTTTIPLYCTNSTFWAFAVADWDRNGNNDLYVIKKRGLSNSTEVHILDG